MAAPTATAASTATAELLDDGRAALEDELYEISGAKLTRYLQIVSTPAERLDAILLLARALHGQKRYQEMLELLEANRDLASGSAQADAFNFWLALANFEQQSWERVEENCRDLEQKYPLSTYRSHALRLQAWALARQGRTNEALACFARLAEQTAATPSGLLNRLDWAEMLVNSGQIGTARNILEQASGLTTDTTTGLEHRNMLGRIYVNERDWDKAVAIYTPLTTIRNVPDKYRAMAFLALAEIAAAQTNPVSALNFLDRGIARISDPYFKGMCNLRKGKLLLTMGKPQEGIALLRGFVAAQSTNALARDVQLELSQILLDHGQPDKALLEFQNYLETFSDPAGATSAQQGKGWSLFKLGRFNEAAAAFEKASEGAKSPEEKAYNRLYAGIAHAAAGQYKLAIESYSRVQTLWPESELAGQAAFQLAECLVRLNELAQAATLFWKIADQDPDSELAPAALLRIADLELRQGHAETAQFLYKHIGQTYSNATQANALHGLGLIEYRADRFDNALGFFEKAQNACPTGKIADRAMYLSAWCQYHLGREEEAVKAFRTFVRLYPDSAWAPDALFWTSEYDYNHARYSPAETGFLMAAKRYPRSTIADSALFWAGRSALMQNEFRRANNHFSTLIKEYPASAKRPEARFYQASALCELGEFAAAILIFEELIKQFPDHYLNETAWLRKGDCQFTLGTEDPKRYSEAIASYQTILDRPDTKPAIRMQAEYKTGRCLEKAQRAPEAFERYMNVVYLYSKTTDHATEGTIWFTRAAFRAAALKEAEQSWRKASAIYQRIVNAGVPASAEALARINRLQTEHWLHFY